MLNCNLPSTQPFLTRYREIRDLAGQLGRWETVRSELLDFLDKAHNTTLLIQIALDEGEIDKALELVKAEEKRTPNYGGRYHYNYGYFNIALDVAKAAEETRPREAIELYRQHAEWLIAQRERKHYQTACKYLAKMRTLYEKLGEHAQWTSYITSLREQRRISSVSAVPRTQSARRAFCRVEPHGERELSEEISSLGCKIHAGREGS